MLSPTPRRTVCCPLEGQGPRRGPLTPLHGRGPEERHGAPQNRTSLPSGLPAAAGLSPWAHFGIDCKHQPCSVPEQLEIVAATAGALRLKGSAGGNVLLPSGGSFPGMWKPCHPLPVQWFCHPSVPTPYFKTFTVLGSLLQSWPGFLLSHKGFLSTVLVSKEL